MNEWLTQLDINSAVIGLLAGLVVGIIIAMAAARSARRKGAEAEMERLLPVNAELEASLKAREEDLSEIQRSLAVTETRLEEQQQHHQTEKASLEEAEKRLSESFERLAGKVFDERSQRFTELSEKQLSGLLKPLTKDLETFRSTVDKNSREDIRQHAALQEKLRQMESLNERLHKEAQNLTKALTSDVKAQGNWGEQQLERLMELAGLIKGEHYYTQYSTVGKNGERLQPVHAMIKVDLLPSLKRFLDSGERKIDRWYAQHDYARVDFSDCANMFRNINTPADRDSLQTVS
jgi:DNA anti-recombination protein RmuC